MKHDGRYLSVRLSDVLRTRGSVLNLFREQITAGGPVMVTDPDVTCLFMTVGETVHLALQAAAVGRSGTTLILYVGSPVRIADMAEQLHEVLIGRDAMEEFTSLPLIAQVSVRNISIQEVRQVKAVSGTDDDALVTIVSGRVQEPVLPSTAA